MSSIYNHIKDWISGSIEKPVSAIIEKPMTQRDIDNNICEKFFEYIDSHSQYPWNWRSISQNPKVTTDYIDAHPEKTWDWEYLSANPSVTMEYIKAHPEKEWSLQNISDNPSLTIAYLEENLMISEDKPNEAYQAMLYEENMPYRCRLIRHFHTFLKRKVIRVTESGDPFKHVPYEL